jgi:predicted TIM-barrel fold metal-dependent hydrolase
MAADADISVIYHSSDNGLRWEMAHVWGWGNINVPARNIPPLQRIIASHERSIHDTIATLIYGKVFERFPTLRFAAVELGSSWVSDLVESFDRVGKGDLDEDPLATFKKHFWVTPFEDDDIRALSDTIGVDRLMFGSDFPHTDGLAEPSTFATYLDGFDAGDVRKIMHDNARKLIDPKAVV